MESLLLLDDDQAMLVQELLVGNPPDQIAPPVGPALAIHRRHARVAHNSVHQVATVLRFEITD
jgi:hypothetical protein